MIEYRKKTNKKLISNQPQNALVHQSPIKKTLRYHPNIVKQQYFPDMRTANRPQKPNSVRKRQLPK